MNYERYRFIESSTRHEFKFYSEGISGVFEKRVFFDQTEEKDLFHLSFGDYDEQSGTLDVHITSSNNDRDQILATIAAIVYEFTEKHPTSIILFTGSTKSRTRLYRMAITKNLTELSKDFDMYIQTGDKIIPFEPNRALNWFLVRRKIR